MISTYSWPWSSRIDYLTYFKITRKKFYSHLELVILESSQFFLVICQSNKQKINYLFSEVTSSRWQEENNKLQFSVTGIDDQGPYRAWTSVVTKIVSLSMCGWMIISIMLLIFKEENQKDFKSKQYNKSEKVTQFVSLKNFTPMVLPNLTPPKQGVLTLLHLNQKSADNSTICR